MFIIITYSTGGLITTMRDHRLKHESFEVVDFVSDH